MAQHSAIEWTDATWNPVTGCTKVGPGCDNCYAERFAERWRGIEGHPYEQGFDLRIWPSRLQQPSKWKKPRMIFVNSMSDLFHKDIDRSHIDKVFDTMEQADWHIYQILTKRSSLMRKYVSERYGATQIPSHIWLGVSVEDSLHKGRIQHLRQINSEARFISFEPLLGPKGFVELSDIAWVIVDSWRRERSSGATNEVRVGNRDTHGMRTLRCCLFSSSNGAVHVRSREGRLLEGAEWNGFPWKVVPQTIADKRFSEKGRCEGTVGR